MILFYIQPFAPLVMLIRSLPRRKFIICLLLLSGLLAANPPARSHFHGPPAIELTEVSKERLRQSSPAVHQSKPASKRQTVIGKTSLKSPIIAFRFGRGKQYVIILGGMHGDEPSSARVAEAFAASLERDPPPAGVSVMVIPKVNPDGLKAGTRSNSVGVDINRNFPSKTWRPGSKESRYYPGPEPMSERETHATVTLIKKWRPALLISIHAPLQCINWDGPAEGVSNAMAQAIGFSLCRDVGYETPGSLGSYAGKDLDIPTVTLELGDNLTSEEITNQGLRSLRAALEFMSSAPSVTRPRGR
jgi:hypothetical protein